MRTNGTMKVTVFERDITEIGLMMGLADLLEEASVWIRDERNCKVVTRLSEVDYHYIYNIHLNLGVDYDGDTGHFTAQLYLHYDDNTGK